MATVTAIPKLNAADIILDATIGTSDKIFALVYNPTDKLRIDYVDIKNGKFTKGSTISGISCGSATTQPTNGYYVVPGTFGGKTYWVAGLAGEYVGSWGVCYNFCNNLTLGGESDWYMPSKAELDFIYSEMSAPSKLLSPGGSNSDRFADVEYWSTTDSHMYMWYVDMGNGDSSPTDAFRTLTVRAIRSF
jgi:hypothetical protein